jgi:hypothetical protein
MTPLLVAANAGHAELIPVLVEAGADIERPAVAARSACKSSTSPTIIR